MFQLANADLRVDLLDPVADAARLGPRYCWGGYVWQVHDRSVGPLLSGPEWPEPAPDPFNGQGLPESFRHRTLDGRLLTWRGDRGIAIGAGTLRADAKGEVTLVRPCTWEVERASTRLMFKTRDDHAGFRYELTRTIELTGRELRSRSELTNTAAERLKLEWFAHPFFALSDGVAAAEFPAGSALPDNPGFTLQGRTLAQKRRFLHVNDGHMERGLILPPAPTFTATLAHPALTGIEMTTDFCPAPCILWGNDRTFSIEPYLTLDLAPGDVSRWSVSYRFGSPVAR